MFGISDNLPPDEKEDDGVMFKITAKTCKKWADNVHKEALSDLLNKIAEAAKRGKYSIVVDGLSEEAVKLLTEDGFMLVDQDKNKTLISWL